MGDKYKYKRPHRCSAEVEALIFGWLYRAGRPLRWKELMVEAEKEHLKGTTLSNTLKIMRSKGVLDVVSLRCSVGEHGIAKICYVPNLEYVSKLVKKTQQQATTLRVEYQKLIRETSELRNILHCADGRWIYLNADNQWTRQKAK